MHPGSAALFLGRKIRGGDEGEAERNTMAAAQHNCQIGQCVSHVQDKGQEKPAFLTLFLVRLG